MTMSDEDFEKMIDGFTEDEIFKCIDYTYQRDHYWRKMPPIDFSSINPKQIIVFGGATCRAERAVAWLKSRNITYPFEVE